MSFKWNFLGAMTIFLAVNLTAHAAESGRRTEKRDVESFTRIEVHGAITLDVLVGAKQEVSVESKNADVGLILTTVKDGILTIQAKDPERLLKGSYEARVEIKVRKLAALTVSGAASGKVEGIKGDSFEFDASGAAGMELHGKVKTFVVNVAGAARVDAPELIADIVTADITGAGSLELYAGKELTASVAGAGRIVYHGSPAKVIPRIAGIGKIEPFQK